MKRCALLLSAVLLALLSALSYAQAPVPFINLPLMPDATAPGGADFTLTVNGTGFVSNSVVNWNGTALATQFVNGSQVTAIVPASNIATATTGWITVVNPAPGGGTSSVAFFTVTANAGNSIAFTLASTQSVGFEPSSVAVGDFNGDGKSDLAVADWGAYSEATLSVLLGDGTGNFTLGSSMSLADYLDSVAVGDFNGDGFLDLAVVGNNAVYILLGDGAGNFTMASSSPVGIGPRFVAVGDFNGDGKLDLAVADWCATSLDCVPRDRGGVSILLGDGTGNFAPASTVEAGYRSLFVAVGDFNGDGKLDLAVVNECANQKPTCDTGSFSILLGDGTGYFALASSQLAGRTPFSGMVDDFNGDGKLDLAVLSAQGCNTCTSGSVSIFLGDGAGNFKPHSTTAVDGWQVVSMAAGDFNGDSVLDLATANQGSNTASVLLGDGTGRFTFAALPPVGSFPSGVAVGDFTGNGQLGMATANAADGTASVLVPTPPALAVTLSPSSLTFATQLINTSSGPQPVTLTNSGNALLKIGKVTASTNFTQTNNCSGSLGPGAQCAVNVTFTPQSVGTLMGTIRIMDNAPNSPQTVPLTGVGTAVTLLPSSIDFGNQPVGTSSQPQAVTFTNYAPLAVTIFGGGLTGNSGAFGLSNNTCGNSVPAGGSCTISVTFTPKYPGPKNATLNVNDNGGASPQTVTLSGNGT